MGPAPRIAQPGFSSVPARIERSRGVLAGTSVVSASGARECECAWSAEGVSPRLPGVV